MPLALQAQEYKTFSSTISNLYLAASLTDTAQRQSMVDKLWQGLILNKQIPFISSDSVAFLYRGQGKSLEWLGDFNGWGFEKSYNSKGHLIPHTNIWILKTTFPKDARLDYKIVVDGNWILDPQNPFQQWSGVGGGSPNSELRMPDWKDDSIHQKRMGLAHGRVSEEILFTSKILGYQITYTVYTPAHATGELPVIYVTDGYEYMHPKMGDMITVLDNLIAEKKIHPVMAVFVDHREPINRSNNRRMQELSMNSRYLDFFTTELIPQIEMNYPAAKNRESRAILGTSLGGLSSAFFIFSKPNVFGMAGIQSPAFWTRPQIYSLCDSVASSQTKISMTSGVIFDASEGSRKMKLLLENNACQYTYREVNEGHSWGNWRNLVDDILIDFFGTK